MLYQALRLINHQLNSYLGSIEDMDDEIVVLGNIAQYEMAGEGGGGAGMDSANLKNKIVLSLIKTEEENTLKNKPPYIKKNEDPNVIYKNAPVNLNLFLLFSVTSQNYNNALIYLSRVIKFFQGKRVFTSDSAPIPNVDPQIENMEEFKLIADLYSLTFEELNHLWGTLGGKQFPSVLYKFRLTSIDREQVQESSSLIEEIEANNQPNL